ncbi:hypothetical protein N5D48_05300 [Pseudomonas sp. GD03858]|uniref:hypothetical protein n=1 Tax=unclassified Pseudomonas TaxID=196821 RepID=UPI002447DE90|nr:MULTISPECIES: hypothetical protein [unclassified Pseudomonas]MDH0646190.1 hypothetical protein [Pseudomonas sp. GD03867]MDH0661811.1 hypothetical protein [Pseudomonas sp. GD03858]
MEKVYRLLDWLTFENALDWLRTLTDTPLSGGDLWRLVLSGQCDVYIQALGLNGHYMNDDGHEVEVIGRGFQLVVGSETIRKGNKKNGIPEKRRLSLEGARYEPDPRDIEMAIQAGYDYWEAVTESDEGYPLYFKPADIEALAAKINGTAEYAAEVEALREELEQERAMRQAAESELRERRAKDGQAGLDFIRQTLSHTPAEFAVMKKRAEDAERMVVVLDHQLTEQDEVKRRNNAVFNGMARQLEELHKHQRVAPVSSRNVDVSGLNFPYSTKQLEAARNAANKYWVDYDPERPPLQKQVASFIAEQGVPARQAQELAIAIKPDAAAKA